MSTLHWNCSFLFHIGIGFPWNTPRRDHNLGPTADLSLGETIAVVDPSEVITLPQNTHVSGRGMIPGLSEAIVSGTQSSQTNGGGFPNAHFEEDRHGLSSGLSHSGKTQNLAGLELQGNGHIRDNSNNQVHHGTGQTITDLTNIIKTSDQGLVNNNKADVQPAIKLGETLLQTLAKKVVSKLVDKIVNVIKKDNIVHVINKENPGLTRPGNSNPGFVDRHGFNLPFLPVAHSHGPRGEVIPVPRADHVHSPHGHIIPSRNHRRMTWRQRYPHGWIK